MHDLYTNSKENGLKRASINPAKQAPDLSLTIWAKRAKVDPVYTAGPKATFG